MPTIEYIALIIAGVAGLLQFISKPWPLTLGVLWGVVRTIVVAYLIVWLFATIYYELIAKPMA
jgi:hypothetical protein